jgi:hypothetical protein
VIVLECAGVASASAASAVVSAAAKRLAKRIPSSPAESTFDR